MLESRPIDHPTLPPSLAAADACLRLDDARFVDVPILLPVLAAMVKHEGRRA